ncbi:c-type heme family protein [Polaribacter staleyi]|uniref:c-type heme family protein n=1 Tax=Polaribacter staleyi TaxID=2022337 RepID=UPI0031BA27AA
MKFFSLFIALAFIFGCKDAKKTPSYSKKAASETQEHVGKKLMETNCYVCHNATTPEDNRIAPPMIAIKKRYLMGNSTKASFIASMQNWIKNPTKENAIMYGAVQRFGLMPKQAFPEETIQQIADYMFESEIEKPAWFDEHYNQQHGNGNGRGNGMGRGNGNGMQRQQQGANFKNLTYSEKGLKYALGTKAVLGKNLMGTIQKKGTLAALKFCNVKAYPLTDSMSVVYKTSIKRVSDKPRNASNAANNLEKEYITVFKKDAQLNKESEPIVVESAENVKFYYPIKTNSMCLQCHGKPTLDIKSNTLAEINKLYPKDLAVGYAENQVRGIWSITFHKQL